MGMLRLLLVRSNSDRCCPTVGNPGWDMEDGQAKRRTEDEDNMLGMTQKVSQANTNNKGKK